MWAARQKQRIQQVRSEVQMRCIANKGNKKLYSLLIFADTAALLRG
jgi:hypothetical protein